MSAELFGAAATPAATDPIAPMTRTLRAIEMMASRLHPHARCAVLFLENDRLIPAAEYSSFSKEAELFSRLPARPSAALLIELANQYNVAVKPLITTAAELIGAMFIFGVDPAELSLELNRDLQEIGWMATLTIEQKHLAEELAYRAHHDPLTHCHNRVWMEQEIDRVLDETRDRHIALAIIGLDRFRVINDVLGYQIGNELLRQVVRRIANGLSRSFTFARFGGDEFMVLMPDLPAPDLAAIHAHMLLDCFDAPFSIGEHELILKASIGCAVSEGQKIGGADFQAQALTALRYAKSRTRGKVAAFEASMLRVPPERLVMEQHLRFALAKREFELYYQPQIDLASGRLIGLEALIRWNHPSLGYISPSIFIPAAEEIGIIEDIGDWVIDEAIRQLQVWQQADAFNVRVAVNVSALQFSRPNFGSSIAHKLRRFGIAPERLELEITESAIMSNFESGLRQMETLRSLGIQIAIDDFGTGHSSLAYLQQLPVHRLKVDRMFVREISSREQRPPLLSGIVNMAHALNLIVIAEGAETIEQLLALSAMGCEEVQGFIFSKAMPAREVQPWLKERGTDLEFTADLRTLQGAEPAAERWRLAALTQA
ncbi:MAG TPA: bifunctional diguanylate cyclase/phosphodiesterase [Bryobacteraceae bacterium]|jgi:diguanylate cyclase (GGDEF)-like protein|nr:bifunctional diguanylate cyclase/phosphodiesterase [Bryobacteraceae bacterium]